VKSWLSGPKKESNSNTQKLEIRNWKFGFHAFVLMRFFKAMIWLIQARKRVSSPSISTFQFKVSNFQFPERH
jgi:hypothetical protein